MRTIILCLGNEGVPGEGVVARVGRILNLLPLPGSMRVRVAPALDWEGVDAITECEQLIVVDTMVAGTDPGTCFVEEVSPHHLPTFTLYCRHRQAVKDIVQLSELLALEGLPKRLVFVGVESRPGYGGRDGADQEDGCGDGESTVALVVDSVLRSFGAEVALRRLVAAA